MKEAREAGSNPSHQIIKHSHIALVSRHNNAVRLLSIKLGGRADASHGMTRTSRFILCTSRFITLMKLGKIGPALLHVCVSVSAL
jgi:hypothetical protein